MQNLRKVAVVLLASGIACVAACADESDDAANDDASKADASSADGAPNSLPDGAPNSLPDGAAPDATTGGPWALPAAVCTPPAPLADVSPPTTKVGDGTPASCTDGAFGAAVAAGGVITFDCGPDPYTLLVVSTKEVPLDRDTVIDGGGKVTLDGGKAVRILSFVRPDYRKSSRKLTLQRLRFVNGRAPGSGFVAKSGSNPKCAYGYKEGGGGAVLVRDNLLDVIDSVFESNEAATPGPDVGGGAIYALGSLGVTVVHSRFSNNSGSNAGAVGLLQTNGTFANVAFENNVANGVGTNYAGGDATGCPGVGHTNQGGAGGNGGAMAIDGSDDTDQLFCGVTFRGNKSNELAGALFRTANGASRKTHIERSSFIANTARSAGALYLRNSKPLEIHASTFTQNTAEGSGMAQLDECTVDVINTTIHGNVATKALGGAISNFFGTTGTFLNVTFANNTAEAGAGIFSAAIAGQMNFQFHNSIFWNNTTLDSGSPMTCSWTSATGSNNLQWPQKKKVGGANDNACVTGIAFGDALLGALADNGGPMLTARPGAGSPALSAGANCPPTDQLGNPRATTCTLGAVE